MPPERSATPDCPPASAFVELVDGRLAEPAAALLEEHAEVCATCRALLAELEISAGETEPLGVDATQEGVTAGGLSPDGARSTGDGASAGSMREPLQALAGGMLDRKYRLVRLLGKGGMGFVYEAEHTGTGRRVAVKIINRRMLARGSEGARRFRREARAAGRIDSSHIVQILDSGADEATGGLYLVMEYLYGEDLQLLLDRTGPLPPDVALRIVAQALLGLQKAHDAGIVHRDIKPANLFLSRHDEGEVTVKLLDFGIAKIMAEPAAHSHSSSGITYTGGLLGSPLYMSPEQVQNSKDVDHRADLWSLGAVLYCALAGRAPHEHARGVGKLILAICSTPAPSVQERAPWVPPEAADAVRRALVIDPAARYLSAAAMFEAIRRLLPGGLALREEMLVGIPPGGRATLATRSASVPPAPSTPPEAGLPTPPETGLPHASGPPTAPETASTPAPEPASPVVSETRARGASRVVDPPVRSGRPWRWSAVAALLVAVVAGALLLVKPWLRRRSAVLAAETLASFSPLPSRGSGPADPLADARAELGRALFHDPRLSKNGDIACTTCHPLERYGVDGKRVSRGSDGREPPRNTPSVYNASGFFVLLWDGRQSDLVAQAKEVLLSPRAMATTREQLPEALRAIPSYASAFARAFPDDREPLSFENTAQALAAFEATLFTRGRWDRFLEGDRTALSDDEKAGFNRFVEVGCIACHFGPNIGATMFQKAGLVKAWPDTKDKGRYEITKRDVDWMVFRVPSLRDVAVTGPYFHDGSVASLDTAIRMMGHHQIGRELDDEDVTLIRSWLGCLTGEIPDAPLAPRGADPPGR